MGLLAYSVGHKPLLTWQRHPSDFMSEWKDFQSYEMIQGKECFITLEARPHYCDRGNWIAKLFPSGMLELDIDHADGWPRYYFDKDRAKLEIEAWLLKRGQSQ